MQLRIMGVIPSVISFLIVLTVGRHVVSATDCRESNCEFVVQEECQTSESVTCSMKKRPLKQIHITAASFPRDAREIKISDAETITIGEDAIANLTYLDVIEISYVNNLILQNRSLARGGISLKITLTIRAVTYVQLHSETFEDWIKGSRITITDVDDCQLLPFSTANAQLRELSLSKVKSLVVHENAFSGDSVIEKIDMRDIKSLSISKQAFTSNVTVKKTWIEDIKNLTIHSGALSRGSRMEEVGLKGVKYLTIEPDGIEADIDDLRVKDVEMEMCGENTFGGKIGYLSLSSTHIKRATKRCISASTEMKQLVLENSEFDEIETSGICGTVENVRIKNNTFGGLKKAGLQLNVTKFSIEYSTIAEASKKALTVRADNDITIRNCTIDVLQKGAFSSLSVMPRNGTDDYRIRLDKLHIKRPQNGSLQFGQNQTVTVHGLELGINCTCDIETLLGLDASSENKFWIDETLCEVNSTGWKLDDYLQEFCPEPTTIPPSNTSDELNDGDGSDQTSGDGSDQVRTGSTHNVTLIATISVVVLIAMIATLLVCRMFNGRSCRSVRGSEASQYSLISHGDDRQARGPDSRPTISAPTQFQVLKSADTASCQASVQTASTCQTSVGSVGTHTSRGTKMERGSKGAQHNPPATQSLTGAPGEPEQNRSEAGDAGNETGDTLRQEMTVPNVPDSTARRGTEQSQITSPKISLMPYTGQRGAIRGPPFGHGDYGGMSQYITVPRPPSKPLVLDPLDSTYRAGGNLDGLSQPADERCMLLDSYRTDRQKDPRVQRRARDPQHVQKFEKETSV